MARSPTPGLEAAGEDWSCAVVTRDHRPETRSWRLLMGRVQIFLTRKFSPPTGGFFLAPAESWGPSGPKVTLPDGRTDGRTDERTDNGFKGVRNVRNKLL